MIAHRMRPIGWVAGVAAAALSFYLVSLQVASERAELESVERRIVLTQRQIRHLETEFSARASLRQLEAYNNEVLALAAPKSEQYLTDEVQLASYAPDDGGDIGKPATALARAEAPAEAATVVAAASVEPARARPSLKPAVVIDARSKDAPVIPAMKRAPLIQAVAMIEPADMQAPRRVAPAPSRPTPPALKPKLATVPKLQRVALLDPAALADISRQAAKAKKQ